MERVTCIVEERAASLSLQLANKLSCLDCCLLTKQAERDGATLDFFAACLQARLKNGRLSGLLPVFFIFEIQ